MGVGELFGGLPLGAARVAPESVGVLIFADRLSYVEDAIRFLKGELAVLNEELSTGFLDEPFARLSC